MFGTIKRFLEERRLRKEFERFYAEHNLHDVVEKDEAWVHFLACEELGEQEVRRQLAKGVY